MSSSQASNARSPLLKMLIACLVTMLAVSTVVMTHPIFRELSESFAIDLSRARIFFGIVSLFYCMSFFFLGPAVDKYNLPKVASWGALLLGVAVWCSSLARGFTTFSFIMALMGVFTAAIPASMFPYVALAAPKDKIGLYVGAIVSSATLGVTFGRVLMGVLTNHFGWRLSFKLFALGLILLFVVVRFFLREKEEQAKAPGKNLLQLYGLSLRLMATPATFSLLLAGFCLFFGFMGTITFLTYRLIEPPFNFSAGQVGWVSLAGVTALVAPFSGSLANRFGIHRVILASLLISLAALQFLGWFESVFLTSVGLLLLFFGVYACQPLVFLIMVDSAPKESTGSASSLYLLFCIGGGSISSMVLGPVWKSWGWAGITVACSLSLFLSLSLLSYRRLKKEA